jgi:hypothetical protein
MWLQQRTVSTEACPDGDMQAAMQRVKTRCEKLCYKCKPVHQPHHLAQGSGIDK